MAVRTALLTSRNINLDTDFSKYIETVSEPGVITGFAVTASAVATGQAWVPCERTNGETIYAFVQNFNSVAISGDGYVIISIPQNIIDNWGGNEDGTGIATIEVVNELPAKNYLQLATISSGTVTDTRNMIPTVWELKTDINSLFADVADLDERVDKLEAADAIDHLEERALVWENYALTDTLFKQITPKLADSTVEANVWDVAANTEVHIQRLGSGTASNTLKLKVKKTGSPSDIYVEVRKGIKVDVSESEAYWYGDSSNIIATGTLTASTVTTSWQELEFTLDNEFGGTEGELLDIVVYQGSTATVNASNYYVIACDSTQRSEWFSYVSVNWSTRSRSKLMPYCISDGFAQFMLAKVDSGTVSAFSLLWENFLSSVTASSNSTVPLWEYTFPEQDKIYNQYTFKYKCTCNATKADLVVSFNGGDPIAFQTINTKINEELSFTGNYQNTTKFWFNNKDTSSRYLTIHYSKVWKNKTLIKTGTNGKPRELKQIAQKASITIFGVHTDNSRVTQDV